MTKIYDRTPTLLNPNIEHINPNIKHINAEWNPSVGGKQTC